MTAKVGTGTVSELLGFMLAQDRELDPLSLSESA
jgi:hypothetical protein